MIQNIKVDIVYFKTATDFEFEFNLGSCCHMRLLNDKANDKKSFVNSLARAVSRSQIIISCGPLFGEDGLIATAAAAINHGLQPIDNKTYGISSDDIIEVIEGAVPLVTPEGYFGGCIIESGSQSIIILTENRTLRKTIMKNLVHPYIEDISIMTSAETGGSAGIAEQIKFEEAPASKPETAPADIKDIEPQEPAPEQAGVKEEEYVATAGTDEAEPKPEDSAEVPQIETPAEAPAKTPESEVPAVDADAADNADEATVQEPQETQGEHNISFEFEPEGEDFAAPDKDEESTDEAEDFSSLREEDFISDEDTDGGKGLNATIIIITVVLILAILALSYFLIFLPMQNGISTTEYLSRIFSTASGVGKV